MNLQQALTKAQQIKSILSPHCDFCEIGGSIRREKPNVKDIEIICVPKLTTFSNRRILEWQKSVLTLGEVVKGLKSNNLGNAKQLKINVGEIMLDLFIVEHGNVGLQYLIRSIQP